MFLHALNPPRYFFSSVSRAIYMVRRLSFRFQKSTKIYERVRYISEKIISPEIKYEKLKRSEMLNTIMKLSKTMKTMKLITEWLKEK